jgi:cysteine-rich repeat protein
MSLSTRSILFATLLAVALPIPALAIEADSADDVCAPDADPCIVSQVVHVAPEAVLDFGVRDVEVVDYGRFEFGEFGGSIACGSFRALSKDAAIRTARPADASYFDQEGTNVTARRECSDAAPAYPCLRDTQCQLGACGTRLCTGNQNRTCDEDTDCQLGTCLSNRRCSANSTLCTTNADCDLGSCAPETMCNLRYQGRRQCATNTDCELGTCSEGEGVMEIDAPIAAQSPMPVRLELTAAGDLSITAPVNISSRLADTDAGELLLTSYQGSVTIAERIRGRGKHLSRGAIVDVYGVEDVVITGDILVPGGDYDGGELYAVADRDVILESDVRAESRSGGGFGGYVTLIADRDVFVGPGADSARQFINLDGHSGADGWAGDGGVFEALAEGNVSIAEGVRVRARGARGDYTGGGALFVEADGDAEVHGQFDLVARDRNGLGGLALFETGGALTLGSTFFVDVSGGTQGDGDVTIRTDGDTTIAGTLVSIQKGSSFGGEIGVTSQGDLVVSGSLLVAGNERARIDLLACRIDLTSTAVLRNESALAENDLTARESMVLEAGSSVFVESGVNRLTHRAAEKPPVLDGVVEPEATVVVNAAMTGCPECGNSEIDQNETCDDGNVTDGDGCSFMCLIE